MADDNPDASLKSILRGNLIFYLLAVAAVLAIKLFYSRAGSDMLIWILAPTARWAGFLGGLAFTYEPRVGYVNRSIHFIIAPSCSGLQFMSVLIMVLICSFVHRMGIREKRRSGQP